MRRSELTTALAVAVSLLGCTTAYQAQFPRQSNEMSPADASINHCLASLGFEDRSEESMNPESISAEPELVSVWSPPRGSNWSPPPYATATVRRHPDRWTVSFVPSNGQGPEADYFSGAFSRCIFLHEPDTAVGVTSERFIDLR